MKAKTTIDERISNKENKIKVLTDRFNRADKIRTKTDKMIQKYREDIELLKIIKARQQRKKDAAIGDKLVESGVITEDNRKAIESLPEPMDITQEV